MQATYDWLLKKIKFDISNKCDTQNVYVLTNKEGLYSNYFLDLEKVPSPYELKLFDLTVVKMSLNSLHEKLCIECSC